MTSELIVDFPLKRNHDVLRFAETVQLYTVGRHEDKDKTDLWYSKTEYNSMKRNIIRDVLQARRASDSASEGDGGSWIGISHLLAPACTLEVQACRRQCLRAVLAEQARQGSYGSLRWEDIALASLAETGKAVLRARKLAKLHQESI